MPSRNDQKLKQPTRNSRGARLLLEYTGLAARYLAVLGVSVWVGLRIDRHIPGEWPLMVWLLPLFCIIGLMVKAIRDTSK